MGWRTHEKARLSWRAPATIAPWRLSGCQKRNRLSYAHCRILKIVWQSCWCRLNFEVEVQVNGKAWKVWLVPGGVLLALVVALVNSPVFVLVAPSMGFDYLAVFAAGLLLAWRFHSSRMLFSLLTLLLAHRAVEFFSAGRLGTGPGHTAQILAALLVPINFIAFAVVRERGLALAGIAPRACLLFLESVAVAVLCRPENSVAHSQRAGVGEIPVWALLSFAVAVAVFVQRFLKTRRPIEPGFVWSAAAVFLWLEFAPVGKMADAYVATAGLILAASLIETSYVLAYYDELTGIRGRRAFNEALLSLDQQYAIAIVDIDHFKKFNDTYGHDIGDQVLCMVATRISQVSGAGHAFRCGGEEFAVIFRGLSAKEALEHLQPLRQTIEKSQFRVRGAERRTGRSAEDRSERRAGEVDRRRQTKTTKRKAVSAGLSPTPDHLSVTVSIGVAEPSTRYREPEQVIQAADQALYRAKQKGRNRVELASTAPLRLASDKRAKATRL
jgi:diguanylate cyclase (GGDEF)-like protein